MHHKKRQPFCTSIGFKPGKHTFAKTELESRAHARASCTLLGKIMPVGLLCLCSGHTVSQ